MKKIVLVLICLFSIQTLSAMTKCEKDFSKFDSFMLNENDYKHADNWKQIVKGNDRFFVFYRTEVTGNTCYIAEFYYVLVKGNTKYLLGGFDIKTGFLDDNLNHCFDISEEENDFRKNYLLGLAIVNMRSPFSLRGIAKDTTGKVYITETLKRFIIDDENMVIVPWSPF